MQFKNYFDALFHWTAPLSVNTRKRRINEYCERAKSGNVEWLKQKGEGNKCHQEKQHSEEYETKRNVSDESNCMIDLWATREWIFYYMCFFSSFFSLVRSFNLFFCNLYRLFGFHFCTHTHCTVKCMTVHRVYGKHLWANIDDLPFSDGFVCIFGSAEWMNEREVARARACTHAPAKTKVKPTIIISQAILHFTRSIWRVVKRRWWLRRGSRIRRRRREKRNCHVMR